MTTFAPDESPRSLQLYTVDPDTTFAAAKMIVDEGMADHIDMNFGCPVPKVTRRGGGAALPFKRQAVRPDRGRGGARHRGHRHPGHREVPDRHRRRPPHPPRRRPDRRRGGRRRRRTACPHRGAALLRDRRLGADRRAEAARHEHPGARQRRHLRRRRRAGHDGRHRVRRRGHRPRLPGQAVAVRRAVGRVRRRDQPPPRPHWARSRRSSAGTASCWPPISARTRACATSASTSRGTCTDSRPAPTCAGHWRWSRRWPSSTSCSISSTRDVPFPPAADGPARTSGVAGVGGAAGGLAGRSG